MRTCGLPCESDGPRLAPGRHDEGQFETGVALYEATKDVTTTDQLSKPLHDVPLLHRKPAARTLGAQRSPRLLLQLCQESSGIVRKHFQPPNSVIDAWSLERIKPRQFQIGRASCRERE